MADEKPQTVTVESLEWHTYNGKEYPVGATYDIDEQLVDSVQRQGKAVRVDRAAHAKQAEKAAAKPAKAGKPVKPLSTKDIPTRKRTKR
jgi:hypothetical protein